MKLFLLFAVFAGVALILSNPLAACGARRRPVEYRYLPRDLDTYMRTQPLASVQFEDMFESGPYNSPYQTRLSDGRPARRTPAAVRPTPTAA
jgi:hypothetical protein